MKAMSPAEWLEELRLIKGAFQGLGDKARDDLKTFCRAAETCFNPHTNTHVLLEGRRQVWLRIEEFLTLTPEELFERKHPRPLNEGDKAT